MEVLRIYQMHYFVDCKAQKFFFYLNFRSLLALHWWRESQSYDFRSSVGRWS